MPKLHITRSKSINSNPEKVFNTLNDFNEWSHWSPWLICEPEASSKVSDDKKFHEWEGKRIGAGNMKIVSEEPNQAIDYDLTFLKPWKSKAKVRFELKPEGDGTKVTWIMNSSLPFFMFWLKKATEAFIGMDFDRGLNMLKEHVDDGKVNSKLEFIGEGSYPGCNYIGIQRDCGVSEVGELMSKDFEKLKGYAEDNDDNVAGVPFSIYHKWDPVKQKVSYTAGFPLKTVPEKVPEQMKTGSIPATDTYTLRHVGSYLHLGNAWTTLMTMQRAKEFKPKKKFHPFETYVNMPGEVQDSELITDIHFAVR